MPPGNGHGAFLAALERVVLPAVRAFRSDLTVVASGFEAAASDPLGRMLCHSGTYRAMSRLVTGAARELCADRLVLCHEGGYSATYAPFCGLAVIEELSGERAGVDDPMLGWYAAMGGQQLLRHQADLLERAARQLFDMPFMVAAA